MAVNKLEVGKLYTVGKQARGGLNASDWDYLKSKAVLNGRMHTLKIGTPILVLKVCSKRGQNADVIVLWNEKVVNIFWGTQDQQIRLRYFDDPHGSP